MDITLQVVPQYSEIIDGHEKSALSADHLKLNKYEGPDDQNFIDVASKIRHLAKKAPGILQQRVQWLLSGDIVIRRDNIEKSPAVIIESISRIRYAEIHQAIKSNRLPGTCAWLSRKPPYQEWLCSSYSSAFWLHGAPGSGKTKICSWLIDDMTEAEANLAYFYCSRDPQQPELSSCPHVLASLVRQLAWPHGDPFVLPPVKQQCRRVADIYGEDKTPIWNTALSLGILISLTSYYQNLVVVLDGLDELSRVECTKILSSLKCLFEKSACPVKLFIASRDSASVDRVIRTAQKLRISAEDNKADILQFV